MMRAESNKNPGAYSVERCGQLAEVALYEDVQEEVRDGVTVYTYDEHRITVPWREGLEMDVWSGYASWLMRAKEAENAPKEKTPEERIEELAAENELLRRENELTASALEELIGVVLGGV